MSANEDLIRETKDAILSDSSFKEKLLEGITEKAILSEKPMLKSVDTDKRLFTAVVLEPEVVDLHGDIYSYDAVEKACFDFNEFCRNGNLQHIMNTDQVVFVESWIAKSDFNLDGNLVSKGTWVATARIDNEEIWKMCKDGTFTGFSIGCTSLVESYEDS